LQLAGSDANKETIVKSGGLQKIFHLMKSYNEEPSVLQEVSRRSLIDGRQEFDYHLIWIDPCIMVLNW